MCGAASVRPRGEGANRLEAPLPYKVHWWWVKPSSGSCGGICRGSRVDLHGNHREDGVLVSAPHHYPQAAVPLDGGADVGRGWDPLAVDRDDDVMLFESSTGGKKEDGRIEHLMYEYQL